MKLIDLTNQRFDFLVVTRRAPDRIKKDGGKVVRWYCDCDCGKKDIMVDGSNLRRGTTKSCGCITNHLISSSRRLSLNKNTYDLNSYEYGVGYTNKGDKFLFDKEDYDLIKDYCWRKRTDGYLDAKVCDGTNKRILMHNLIMGNKYFDHQNNIRHDNRKENLRAKDSEYGFDTYNQMNKKLQSNNKSGHRGVYFHKRDKIWETYINVGKKRIYLGRYNDYDEAVKVREAAEKKYFGEWSYDYSQELANKNMSKEKEI